MQTKTLKQTLQAHSDRVKYQKTFMKTFIGGMVIGITSWELGGLLTDMVINLIK